MANDSKPAFRPFIPANSSLREFTARSLIVGTLLGMVFGASSLYLTLKVGLTVSASIPVAVISIALFKMWALFGGRDATILEHNIAQTAGSAGESIAFGVGVTMPAILILGFDLEASRVLLVGILGGLLGILMMIPLRRALIVQQHGELKYPEGTACAEVLKAGASHESRAAADAIHRNEGSATLINAWTIFAGFGRMCRRRSSGRRSGAAPSRPRFPRKCWAWATSSGRGFPASWRPAACSVIWS
jgi:putative OPT family oligopeptide transporter